MGMSASQARLLSLQARQSNLEYQGQQINQARTVLSQQATALYNSLLSMEVPTPPSTTDFQTIEYSGLMGATEFTLGTITPEGDSYNVEIKYKRNGLAIKGGSYMAITSYDEPQYLRGDAVDYSVTGTVNYIERTYEEINEGNRENYSDNTNVMHGVTGEQSGYTGSYYYIDDKSGGYVAASSYSEAKQKGDGGVYIATTVGAIEEANPEYNWSEGDDYVYDPSATGSYSNGGITLADFGTATYYGPNGEKLTKDDLIKTGQKDATGNDLYTLPAGSIRANANGSAQVPNPAYDPNEAAKSGTIGGNKPQNITEDVLGTSYENAMTAIANTYPEYKDASGKPDEARIKEDFMVFFQGNDAGTQVPYFVKTTEFQQQQQTSTINGQAQVEVFSLESNGTYDDAVQTPGCQLTFDSSGRISTIGIPILDEAGNPTGNYNTISLEAATVTDEDAYKDAYAEYEYETYLYDQKNKEINAKTEIIQQEDRNLELKLQRLDNERTQITTEIEAVEKVINDNIEASYKTFSG